MRRWPVRVAIGGVAALLLAAAALGVLVVKDMRAAKPVDPPTWAAGVCKANRTFADAISKSRDNVDPTSLELSARKERAQQVGKVEISAAKQLATDLRAITPPSAAEPFHQALVANADGYASAIQKQIDAIAKAATPQQVAVANASARFDLQGNTQDVNAAAADLSPELKQALQKEPQCGLGGPEAGPTPSA